ncbi:MAG: hypothetical protein KIS92_00485 [Planctomycetota bacterium]|nr:hypothetical protein [Planctomycetota bacterium]
MHAPARHPLQWHLSTVVLASMLASVLLYWNVKPAYVSAPLHRTGWPLEFAPESGAEFLCILWNLPFCLACVWYFADALERWSAWKRKADGWKRRWGARLAEGGLVFVLIGWACTSIYGAPDVMYTVVAQVDSSVEVERVDPTEVRIPRNYGLLVVARAPLPFVVRTRCMYGRGPDTCEGRLHFWFFGWSSPPYTYYFQSSLRRK